MSSSRDQSSLDRRARHLLGDQHRLPHVVGAAAPAEAAAEHQLVDVAFGDRQPRRPRHAAASAASPFCVAHQTSHLSAV